MIDDVLVVLETIHFAFGIMDIKEKRARFDTFV